MASTKRKSRNDSFIDDGDSPDSDSRAHQSKKSKSKSAKADTRSPHFTSSSAHPSISSLKQKDSEGNPFWALSDSTARRVNISSYNKRVLVNIREYYEKDGNWLPGKKGISLTTEQYFALVSAGPAIEQALLQQGIEKEEVRRPDYGGMPVSGHANEEVEQDDLDDDGDEGDTKPDMKSGRRKNHEATSDEEED